MPTRQLEELVDQIVKMDRADLMTLLKRLHCNFKLDFSNDFLQGVSVERLRHIILAACLHSRDAVSDADVCKTSQF